jgi:hypothetical protein
MHAKSWQSYPKALKPQIKSQKAKNVSLYKIKNLLVISLVNMRFMVLTTYQTPWILAC